MTEERLAEVVRLACHDLRTPLATISGFAKTMVRAGTLPEREARFLGMIDEATEQMTGLIAQLGHAAALVSGRYVPELSDADTLELVSGGDPRVHASGRGETVQTDETVLRDALAGLAAAALRHGQVESLTWEVDGRTLTLAPIAEAAAPVVDGSSPKELGALVGRLAIERLGGSVVVDGGSLRVTL